MHAYNGDLANNSTYLLNIISSTASIFSKSFPLNFQLSCCSKSYHLPCNSVFQKECEVVVVVVVAAQSFVKENNKIEVSVTQQRSFNYNFKLFCLTLVHFHCLEIFVFNTLPSLSVFCRGIVQTLQTLIYTIRNRKFSELLFSSYFFLSNCNLFLCSSVLNFSKKKKTKTYL